MVICCCLVAIPILIALIYFVIKQEVDLVTLFYKYFGESPKSLNGKVIWITGASTGIGRALAIKLASNGAKLVLSSTQVPKLEEVKQKCLAINKQLTKDDILVVKLDITQVDVHKSKLELVLEHFGKIDILINNAGRYQLGMFADTHVEVDRANFEVNVFGPINLTRRVLKHWEAVNYKNGLIAVTSSVGGKMGLPAASTYAATKFALIGYFDVLRTELRHKGIAVSVICPGPITTDLFKKSFSTQLGVEPIITPMPSYEDCVFFMSADKCADWYLIGLANRISEVWIARQPVLLLVYLFQYFPTVTRVLNDLMNTKERLERMARAEFGT